MKRRNPTGNYSPPPSASPEFRAWYGSMTDAARREADRWLATRPPAVRAMVERFPPGTKATIKGRVSWLISYAGGERPGYYFTPVHPAIDHPGAVASRFFVCADHLPLTGQEATPVPEKKTVVTNTASLVDRDPLGFLAAAVVLGGASNAIEAMESAGQAELVASTQVPTRLMHGLAEADLIAMGFTLGEPTPGDPMFRDATLPAGWTKVATDHAMWSDILDERGRRRLAIFYKAASYDRSAHMSGQSRFVVATLWPEDGSADRRRAVAVQDAGRTIREFGRGLDYRECDDFERHARDWLDAERPDWKSITAYWDEPDDAQPAG